MDRLILNGRICDGSGSEPAAMDLLLKAGRIAEIAPPGTFAAVEAEKIDASGRIVAPGFIDAHSHGDLRKMRYRERKTLLLQGVTTEVCGNCGSSAGCVPGEYENFKWQNFAEYTAIIDSLNSPVNTVCLAGHNSIRRHVMGNCSGRASNADLRAMRQLLEAAFAGGAAGWSSGLTYFPGKFADTAELQALSQVTAGSEKIYATHMRSEGDDIFNAADEAAAVANAGSKRLQISHLKTIFPRNYHKLDKLLETLERYRQELVLYADRYPYIYSSTRIGQILPAPYDGLVDITEKLRASTAFGDEVAAALKHSPRDLATTILISRNMTLAEIAAEKGISLETAAMELLRESAEQEAAYLCMSAENLQRILALPYVCAGSDGIADLLDDPAGGGHPRAVGTFPKFYRMVSQQLSTGEAVRKMTGLPATVFRIPERGFIRKNYIADLVIFDEKLLDSAADFGREKLFPAGISKVLVNGEIAWDAAVPEKIGGGGRFIAVN